MDNLDKNLCSTWNSYADYLKNSIIEENFSNAIEFIEKIEDSELSFTLSDYPLYATLLYACSNNLSKALETLKKANDYGYKGFWRFDPNSNGWSSKTSEDYLLLEPIHKSDLLQNYVKSVYSGIVHPWGFDISTTPLCWFEELELKKKNVKCYISNKKIEYPLRIIIP